MNSKMQDHLPASSSDSKGTWFGTSKSMKAAPPQSAEGIGEMFKEEIKKEDEALEMRELGLDEGDVLVDDFKDMKIDTVDSSRQNFLQWNGLED